MGTSLNAYDVSAGVFVRGLTNLKAQLTKAEAALTASGQDETALLDARLGPHDQADGVGRDARRDLHQHNLADQVHWAAEGARLAIEQLIGGDRVPAASDATNFSDLHQRLDAAIAYLRDVSRGELEAGLDRTIVIEHPRGSSSASGTQFLLAFAIPHFFYHATSAYSILRSEGVELTMGDFLGRWSTG